MMQALNKNCGYFVLNDRVKGESCGLYMLLRSKVQCVVFLQRLELKLFNTQIESV